VRTQLAVDAVVVAFAEEVKIEIGKRGHWAVGCKAVGRQKASLAGSDSGYSLQPAAFSCL
jgi:hypothetical protein